MKLSLPFVPILAGATLRDRLLACIGALIGVALTSLVSATALHGWAPLPLLVAPIGASAVLGAGYAFPFVPVGINSLILIVTGIAFHRASGHSYPHRPIPIVGYELAASGLGMPHPEDIDLALTDLGETFDVSREDLDLLFRRVAFHASMRAARPNGTKGETR